MEAMAARTDGGTYSLVIERNKSGDVGRLELHLSLNLGDLTDVIRSVLYKVSERLSNEGERDLMARLSELAAGLEEQDRGRLTVAELHDLDVTKAEAAAAKPRQHKKQAFDVVLTDAGDRKINVIKAVREVTALGLKEAKDTVETPGAVVAQGVSEVEARRIALLFEAAGATVSVV
jgi:large subunit ribosomal protein L7/L12